MIGSIRGTLILKENERIIVDVNGVGYEIFITSANSASELGSEIRIYTYLHKTENYNFLYGFSSLDERAFFIKLINISDIGPKVAMNILSNMELQRLKSAIVSGDSAVLRSIPRIGQKLAERIIIELKDKLKAEYIPVYKNTLDEALENDAVSALVALGYNIMTARQTIDKIRIKYKDIKPDIAELVKEALKELGTR
jgi:holliday junction DNA helicase RuvA